MNEPELQLEAQGSDYPEDSHPEPGRVCLLDMSCACRLLSLLLPQQNSESTGLKCVTGPECLGNTHLTFRTEHLPGTITRVSWLNPPNPLHR